LLAPQRGLIANGKTNNGFASILSEFAGARSFLSNSNCILPEMSNSGSPPAEPGVYLGEIMRHLISRNNTCGEREYRVD
jgi:hypothetical protein